MFPYVRAGFAGKIIYTQRSDYSEVTGRLLMVGEAGLEPTTPGLEGRCSIQLSYSPVSAIVSSPGATFKLREHP
jgi:hypothetical protein